jgi:hypothetical protein
MAVRVFRVAFEATTGCSYVDVRCNDQDLKSGELTDHVLPGCTRTGLEIGLRFSLVVPQDLALKPPNCPLYSSISPFDPHLSFRSALLLCTFSTRPAELLRTAYYLLPRCCYPFKPDR